MAARQITFDHDYFQDPHKLYRELREEGPIHKFTSPTGVGGWIITDYAAAREILNNKLVGKTPDAMAGADDTTPPANAKERFRRWLRGKTSPWMVSHMLAAEPPEHTRLRKVVQGSLTPSALRALRPQVTDYTETLLANMRGKGDVDLIPAFAFPLPVQVICHILGVPDEHHEKIGDCSRVLSDVIVADPDELRSAAIGLAKVIYPLLRSRKKTPKDDLLSALVQANKDGTMTMKEVMSTVALLLIAGHETTVHLIANTMYTLLQDPDCLKRVKAGDIPISAVIEESLRFECSLPTTTLRQAMADVQVGETTINAGDLLMVSLASANRDPEAFPEPDRFDPERAVRGNLAFGYGIHHCIGAPLARMEAEIAITRLLEEFPNISLAADPGSLHWRESIVFRGLDTLPVTLN